MKRTILIGVLSIGALTLGWWQAGHVRDRELAAKTGIPESWRRKPMTLPVCAAPGREHVSLPPAPPTDPFGATMYPNLQPAKVSLLPVSATCAQLSLLPEARERLAVKEGISTTPASTGEAKEPALDLQVVATLLQEYRRATGSMPAGQLNDEIVRHLQGKNVRGVAVLPKTHPMINADGELMDRWGTPYFFHSESSYVMTVRSAGPDRKFWNSDDVLSDDGSMLMTHGALVAAPVE